MAAKPREERASVRPMEAIEREGAPPPHLSMDEVRQLIRLMDASDLSEIVIERPGSGMRLVLRRAPEAPLPPAPGGASASLPMNAPLAPAPPAPVVPPSDPATVYITAPRVGIFYLAMSERQKPLVAVGDSVRAGQQVGAIETLNVMDEVEANMAGRVTKILVQPGEAVEYGQRLLELTPDNPTS